MLKKTHNVPFLFSIIKRNQTELTGCDAGHCLAMRTTAASTPLSDILVRIRFIASSWLNGPTRTRYSTPFSDCRSDTFASTPINASFARRLSASV